MRREQDAGGRMSAGEAVEFCRALLDRLEQEEQHELAESGRLRPLTQARAGRSAGGTASTRHLGALSVHPARPRRLDARIVRRRPMMLVKKRARAVVARETVAGREIIARN